MKYLCVNILGGFVFDNQFNLVEELKGEKSLDQLKKKYKDGIEVPPEKLERVLGFLKNKKYFEEFYSRNLALTKKKIKASLSEDLLITQAISNIIELERISNLLVKRLREWYSWYLPEFSEKIENNEKFVELIVKKSKEELLKEIKLKKEESMGADLGKEDVEEILFLGKEVLGLYSLRKKHEDYLSRLMKKYCPNLLELAGVTLGAKLIELGKGLKRLALLPASTIQLLGAEKALFRHLKTGAKSPKYGVLVNHPLVQGARKEEKGKTARKLADKLSLSARLDYFKGEFKAKEYRKELEEGLKK